MTVLHDLSRRPGGTFALFAVTLLCLVAIAAPLIAPYGPNAIAPASRFMDPSLQHLLGTDHLGRDILSRLIYGARIALGISLSVIAISLTTGVALGVAAALSSRVVDLFIVGVFVIVLLYVLTNLIADLSQSLLDPRERARLVSGRQQQ